MEVYEVIDEKERTARLPKMIRSNKSLYDRTHTISYKGCREMLIDAGQTMGLDMLLNIKNEFGNIQELFFCSAGSGYIPKDVVDEFATKQAMYRRTTDYLERNGLEWNDLV